MRLVDGDDTAADVRWYWSPPGCKPGPYTIFASGNWSSDPIWPWLGPGEVKGAPRPWNDGAPPYKVDGLHREGTDEEFAKGLAAWPVPADWTWGCAPWQTFAELCLCPSSFTLLPIGASSSIGHPEQPIPVHRSSMACVCWTAGVLHAPTIGPTLSGYGSSSILGSGRGGPIRSSSTACLCFTAGAVFTFVAPTHSGYGSSSYRSHPPFAFGSTACVCFSASGIPGAVIIHPYGYSSYNQGPSTVQTPCCSRPLPRRLYLDITGIDGLPPPGCSCLSGQVAITWDDGFGTWRGGKSCCGAPQPVLFALNCEPLTGKWILTLTSAPLVFAVQNAPLTCNPVNAMFTFPGGIGELCGGQVVIHLHE